MDLPEADDAVSTVAPSLTPQLVIQTPAGNWTLALRGRAVWTIGRHRENAIVLPDPWVSRKHAVLQFLQPDQFLLTDLGGQNGSFVNGQLIQEPVRLQNGDRIILGKTELQFMVPGMPGAVATARDPRKTVLIVQRSKFQEDFWREVLTSQEINAVIEPAAADLRAQLSQRASQNLAFPDLLLLDLELPGFNPVEFCRWSTTNYPQLKIIFTPSPRISPEQPEQHWGLPPGAWAILPALPASNLLIEVADILDQVKTVLQALNQTSLHQEALFSALMALQANLASDDPTSLDLADFILGSASELPPNAAG